MSEPQTVTVSLDDWLAMHRQNGWMTGALESWIHWDGTPEHMARLRETTRAFLDLT